VITVPFCPRTPQRSRSAASFAGSNHHQVVASSTGSTRVDSPEKMERVTGIEPAFSAWEADVLPLNYTRRFHGNP
jgi:hypothetical protein